MYLPYLIRYLDVFGAFGRNGWGNDLSQLICNSSSTHFLRSISPPPPLLALISSGALSPSGSSWDT